MYSSMAAEIRGAFVFLAIILFYPLSLAIYRLFLHPLREFPGPRLAAATKWYEFYFDIIKWPGGMFVHEIEKMHEEYGPIVRINPDEIHVKDSDWFEKLYTNPSSGVRDKYPPAAHMTGTPLGIFGTVDHHAHRQRRAAISGFFSKRTIGAQQQLIQEKIEKFVTAVDRAVDHHGYADMRVYYLALTTDVLCAHCFEYEMNLLDDRKRALEWKNTIKAIAILTPLIKQFTSIIPIAKKFPIRLFYLFGLPSLARILILIKRMRFEANKAIKQNGEYCDEKKDSRRLDIFRTILASKLPEAEKQQERMAQEGFVVIAAGGETTSRVLTNATYYVLANKQSVLPRLQEELNSIMPTKGTKPDLDSLEELQWLTAIIKESLRITALVTSRLPLVAPREALSYEGWTLPQGTPISMTLRDILLDPKIFPEPHAFKPERWLDSNPEIDRVNHFYLPFGRGSRMCIGISLASAELYMTLANLFRRMDLDLFDTVYERDVKVVRDCFIGDVSLANKGIRITKAY